MTTTGRPYVGMYSKKLSLTIYLTLCAQPSSKKKYNICDGKRPSAVNTRSYGRGRRVFVPAHTLTLNG